MLQSNSRQESEKDNHTNYRKINGQASNWLYGANDRLTPRGQSSERNLSGTIVTLRDIFDK